MKTILPQALPAATPPPSLDADHQAKLDQLKGTPAASFDAAYMEMQVVGHRDAFNLHRSYAEAGDNAALKTFAGEVTPTVRMHLQQAENLERSVKGASPVSSNQ
jgi:putative membrane protein